MKKKFIINFFIIFIFLILVLYFSLKDNYKEIINYISNINLFWLIISIAILLLHRVIVGLCSYKVVLINDAKVSFWKMVHINFIIPFFHGITPFSGGGQPMEIYYLHNEGISKTKSTNIVLQNFILYQVALIGVSLIAVVFNQIFGLFPKDDFMRRLVIMGFLINFLVLLISLVAGFYKKLTSYIVKKIITFLNKIKIVKDVDGTLNKFNDYIDNFYNNTNLLKKNKKQVCYVILLHMISLILLYSIPYTIILGMGLKDINYIYILIATTYVMIIGSFVPIPGGTGGIEYGFMYFCGLIISGSVLTAVMLMWRFITYYLAMIIGAIFLMMYRKKVKKCE